MSYIQVAHFRIHHFFRRTCIVFSKRFVAIAVLLICRVSVIGFPFIFSLRDELLTWSDDIFVYLSIKCLFLSYPTAVVAYNLATVFEYFIQMLAGCRFWWLAILYHIFCIRRTTMCRRWHNFLFIENFILKSYSLLMI